MHSSVAQRHATPTWTTTATNRTWESTSSTDDFSVAIGAIANKITTKLPTGPNRSTIGLETSPPPLGRGVRALELAQRRHPRTHSAKISSTKPKKSTASSPSP